MSMDDGSIRILNLDSAGFRAAMSTGAAQPLSGGMCTLFGRSEALWGLSIQTPPQEGAVHQLTYCSADGTVHHLNLPPRWIASGCNHRNRQAHRLVGGFAVVSQKEQRASCASVSLRCLPPENAVKSRRSTVTPEGGKQGPSKSLAQQANKTLEVSGQQAVHSNPLPSLSHTEVGAETSQREVELQGDSHGSDSRASKSAPDVGVGSGALGSPATGKATRPFLPEAVAIHRVVWNPNDGYQTWIAYGGAAGWVHCTNTQSVS
eukprot:TRINITY_DN6514_c0_g1_i1.p1 TRINITY_DN6514_c0_g1~~TRINITY_DN6514_c0_g1_i1.p1  ORF type:complete len:262 (-),score=34.47 TRINITY_DN6514_c0_g1_i1:436-1221(-)